MKGRPTEIRRCTWATGELLTSYHDVEWGVPLHDDQRLFELLVLEGAQAGLAWATILAKRPAYRRAFRDFDIERVARFGPRDLARLLGDAGIVRHEGKLRSAIGNARAALAVVEELGSFDALIWSFAPGGPRQNRWRAAAAVPTQTVESEALGAELRRRGFTYVGSTVCYAFMQAAGLVNDHVTSCFRQAELDPGA